MTHAYTDGLHDAALSAAWLTGVATVLLLVALLVLIGDTLLGTVQHHYRTHRVRRTTTASGRIPGI
jgi:hypothetical protein